MIISTCGFGSTGSSAVTDYLLECNDTQVFDNIEFTLTTAPDGLEDLEYHLMKCPNRLSSGIYAIQRFRKLIAQCSREWSMMTGIDRQTIDRLTNEYLSSITQLSFIGFSPAINQKYGHWLKCHIGDSLILHRIIPWLEKKRIVNRNFDFYPLERVEAAIKPSNFYMASRMYVHNLLEAMGCDFKKNVILDQAFVGNDPAKSFPFYDDPYAIVVDRDPRDLYIFAKVKLLSRGRFMPTDTVENFITYYRLLRDNQPYKQANDRVLVISFEDMVYNYDETVNKIDNFLHLKNNNRQTIFRPQLSAANTNLVRRFPEFQDDIKIIENSLSEYLFPFGNYSSISNNGEMFFGKSPLNKQ